MRRPRPLKHAELGARLTTMLDILSAIETASVAAGILRTLQ